MRRAYSALAGSARMGTTGSAGWGFDENIRFIKGIVQRIRGTVSAVESPIGRMPRYGEPES